MNKKGAEIAIGTIIVIILAVIVLVVLVMGFTGGWKNLWDKMAGFSGGGSNIDSVVRACQVACATESKYDYCERNRGVRFKSDNGELKTVEFSCNELVGSSGEQIIDPEDSGKLIRVPEVDIECEMDCPGGRENSLVFEAVSQQDYFDFVNECSKGGRFSPGEVDKDCEKVIVKFKNKNFHTVRFNNNVGYCCKK